jgi:hypothetical protein
MAKSRKAWEEEQQPHDGKAGRPNDSVPMTILGVTT